MRFKSFRDAFPCITLFQAGQTRISVVYNREERQRVCTCIDVVNICRGPAEVAGDTALHSLHARCTLEMSAGQADGSLCDIARRREKIAVPECPTAGEVLLCGARVCATRFS